MHEDQSPTGVSLRRRSRRHARPACAFRLCGMLCLEGEALDGLSTAELQKAAIAELQKAAMGAVVQYGCACQNRSGIPSWLGLVNSPPGLDSEFFSGWI